MRSLVQYPIKADEAMHAVRIALENYTKNIRFYGCGNIDGAALMMVEKFIEQNKERFDTFSAASLQVIFEDKDAS